MATFDEDKQKKDLAEMHKAEEEELVETLANTKYSIPYINLKNVSIDNEALRSIPEKSARGLKVAPFKFSGQHLMIGVRVPTEELLKELSDTVSKQGFTPNFYMVSQAGLEKVWERYKELSMAEESKQGSIDISSEVLRSTAEKIKQVRDIEKLMAEAMAEGKIHKISRLLEVILAGAIAVRASDVHIEPEQDKCRLRIRLDGVLQDIVALNENVYALLNSRIKLLSGLKLNSRTSQDGRFSITEGKNEINIRTSLIPGAYGESITMRILDPQAIQIDIENMGMQKNLMMIVEDEIKKPNGMILLTGPTGSGKTTTLYAFIRKIYVPEINIVTIEDPIEYHINGVTQTQVNLEKNYTFPEGLHSALRQDPDIIMVGEIRDNETAEIATQAALTGHMVYSTLHTNNAAGAIPRLIDLGVNPKILVSALSLSIAQRLVRRLCPECKKEKEFSGSDKKTIKDILRGMQAAGKDPKNFGVLGENMKIFTPVGCDKCNYTGYRGRIGIFEAIKTDEQIEKIMLENPSEREIKKTALAQGILSMREDGVVKVLSGITSLEEVAGVVDLLEE